MDQPAANAGARISNEPIFPEVIGDLRIGSSRKSVLIGGLIHHVQRIEVDAIATAEKQSLHSFATPLKVSEATSVRFATIPWERRSFPRRPSRLSRQTDSPAIPPVDCARTPLVLPLR
jgi:hypothetical protein